MGKTPEKIKPEEIRRAVALHNNAAWDAYQKMTLREAVFYCCGYTPKSNLPEDDEMPDNVQNTRNALLNEIRAGKIKTFGSEKVGDKKQANQNGTPATKEPVSEKVEDIRKADWNDVIVTKESVDDWLGDFKSSPNAHRLSRMVRYAQILDANSEYYSNRLAAALEAVAHIRDNPRLYKNDQPKEAVMKYLAEHRKDITPTARVHIAKVVNWKTAGGRKRK